MEIISLFLLAFAWCRIEFRENNSSNGIGSLILGCLIFGFGAVNLVEWDKVLSGALVGVGLFIALVGVGRFVAHEVKER